MMLEIFRVAFVSFILGFVFNHLNGTKHQIIAKVEFRCATGLSAQLCRLSRPSGIGKLSMMHLNERLFSRLFRTS